MMRSCPLKEGLGMVPRIRRARSATPRELSSGASVCTQFQVDPAVGVKIATLVTPGVELSVNLDKVSLLPFQTKLIDAYHLIAQVHEN